MKSISFAQIYVKGSRENDKFNQQKKAPSSEKDEAKHSIITDEQFS